MKTNTCKRILAIGLLVTMCMAMLAACGGSKPSGVYSSDWIGSFEFKGGNKVSYTDPAFGFGEDTVYEGTYTIDGDKIVFDFGTDEALPQGENTFEMGDGWIKIDGITFTKDN